MYSEQGEQMTATPMPEPRAPWLEDLLAHRIWPSAETVRTAPADEVEAARPFLVSLRFIANFPNAPESAHAAIRALGARLAGGDR